MEARGGRRGWGKEKPGGIEKYSVDDPKCFSVSPVNDSEVISRKRILVVNS